MSILVGFVTDLMDASLVLRLSVGFEMEDFIQCNFTLILCLFIRTT